MEPFYEAHDVRVYLGDCIEVMRSLPENSVHAIVTDPPYDLTANKKGGSGEASLNLDSPAGRSRISTGGGFLGKQWDATGVAFRAETWAEALRVLKPGGHLMAFGASRTYHRMASAVEIAGFEIRDTIMWLYGQGFPKSPDVGNEAARHDAEAAAAWSGWRTTLKPAHEPIVVARKPLAASTVGRNVIEYGTGALNIDATRIPVRSDEVISTPQSDPSKRSGVVGSEFGISGADVDRFREAQRESVERTKELGRWPANVVMDEQAANVLDEQSGIQRDGIAGSRSGGIVGSKMFGNGSDPDFSPSPQGFGGSGGASRFFYQPKASRKERDGNPHPTVKPIDLMRWLVRMTTPKGGVVLDPFSGSGSTLVAAMHEGVKAIGIEKEEEYIEVIVRRLGEPVSLSLELDV